MAASARLADTGQPYRAAWWLTWIFAVGFVVSMLGNVMLGAVIVRMLPLKEVVPMLLTTSDRTNQVVRVEPWETRTQGRQLLVETLVKRYVELRETIDLHTEVPRWQEVSWLSSDDVWGDFRKLMDKSNPDSPFEKRKKDRVTRDVKARLVAEVSPDVYQVEWEA